MRRRRIAALLAGVVALGATLSCADEPAAPPAGRLDIVTALAAFRVGDTATFTLVRIDPRGVAPPTVIPPSRATWRSSNPAVFTIDARGFATAIAVGAATISAELDGQSATTDVTSIMMACILSVTVSPGAVTLAPGDTVSAQTNVGRSCTRPSTSSGVTWTSADSTVVAVEARDGDRALLRAKKPGQVAVTARSNDDPTVSGALAAIVVAR